MPLLKLQTSASLSEEKQRELLACASKAIAAIIGKPEQYVMVSLETQVPMLMAGKPGDAVFADVRSIGGLSGQVNKQISQQLAEVLQQTTGITADRMYVNFTSIAAENWGWKGGTFG